MTDREKIIEAFAGYELYAHDLPAVTIKSGVYLEALKLLREKGNKKACCRDCEYYGACHDE